MVATPSIDSKPIQQAVGRQSDAAFAILKDEIVSCRLAPGSSFSEAALSLRFALPRAAGAGSADASCRAASHAAGGATRLHGRASHGAVDP